MAVRAIALLGAGLDGQLAMALLQQQGIDVIAATFCSAFTNSLDAVQRATQRLAVPLHVIAADEAYYERVRHPRHGYTREMSPCLDTQIYILRAAIELQAQLSADFIATGDVIGQRLPVQSKRDLAMIDIHAGLENRVVRPLSARLLPITSAESTGLVDRAQLLALQGRGRQAQYRLAEELGWPEIPAVTSGSLLADSTFAAKLRDLLKHDHDAGEREFLLLRIGRHYRITPQAKVVIGRNAEDNAALHAWFVQHQGAVVAYLSPGNFVGPSALLVGQFDEPARTTAAQLVWHARKKSTAIPADVQFQRTTLGTTQPWTLHPSELEAPACNLPSAI